MLPCTSPMITTSRALMLARRRYVTPNGDAVTGKINGALDSASIVQRLGTLTSPLMTTDARS